MALPLFSRLGLGVGLGVTAATLHPLSPFRTAPMQCQYTAPYYRPETQANVETGWAVKPEDPILQKQGKTGLAQRSGFMTKENMRQVSLGSVLGLVAGVGLRAFSKALVVLLGMGVVLIEVCYSSSFSFETRYTGTVDLRLGFNWDMSLARV
ncbi:hypothetical protein N7532_006512 [Penicillium argentinense]|uniref:Uncharacterized protein n=1 Tax=Penicillium argentinense TaxID=1131581 RepID=A0A9W9KBD8_9EURO|nr:uncharacterized protein N7532_006512 [Penicillium argentinense]KAJ5099511.1 hypothetical protein N7532_006512 [Penicillium argentinense]